MKTPRTVWSLPLLLLLACPGDDTSTTSGPDDTSTSAGSGSGSATSTSTASTSTGDTSGGDSTTSPADPCVDPSHEYFVPGCEPSPEDVTVAAGCYLPCRGDAECGDGVCVTVWVDPCFEQPCAACGGQQDICLEGLPTGAECMADEECGSGVCWDFSDYDECCFGTLCTGPCTEDGDCIALAEEASAPTPEFATCQPDGRCDLVSTGLPASLACAGPPCG